MARTPKIVDYVRSKLPEQWWKWCPRTSPCCCTGCVNDHVNLEEWEAWKARHKFCEHCLRWERKDTQ